MKTRSNLTAVARANCSACQGLGAQLVDGTPCPCALREIFRQCHSRFRDCNNKPKHLSAAILMRSRGASASVAFVRPNENYIADFISIAKRALGARSFHYAVFNYHFLLGADAGMVCGRLNINMPTFTAACEHIRCVVGLALFDTRPFPLFPPDAYFSSSTVPVVPTMIPAARPFVPVRPPLAQAA